MKFNLAKSKSAIIYVEPDGKAIVIPTIGGAWVQFVGAGLALLGAAKAGQDTPDIEQRPLDPDEIEIINRMEELSVGNPELGQKYLELTKGAAAGDAVSPGLERDLESQRLGLERGLEESEIGGTAAVQARGTFEEGANIAREDSRLKLMDLGEQLMASRSARLTGAGATALAPLAEHRGEGAQIGLANVASDAAKRAGAARVLGQAGSAAITSRGK
ncbi:MAG: hypothetical protein V3U75_01325 [Methylococcaceae bacterium]